MLWGSHGWTASPCACCTRIQQGNQRRDVISISHLKLNICLKSLDTHRLCIRNMYREFKLWVISYIFHQSQGNSRKNRPAKEQFSSLARRGRKTVQGKILMGSQAKKKSCQWNRGSSILYLHRKGFAVESAAENKWVNSCSLAVVAEQVAFETSLLGGKAKWFILK